MCWPWNRHRHEWSLWKKTDEGVERAWSIARQEVVTTGFFFIQERCCTTCGLLQRKYREV